MAYGLLTQIITDDDWHSVTSASAIVQCSRDYIFRYGSSTAPDNSDKDGIRAQSGYIVTNTQSGVFLYIRRMVTNVPLSLTVTGDVV